jgi:hypothetical protein
MVLGCTQPRTQMSTSNLPEVKCGRCVRLAISRPSVLAECLENVGASMSQYFISLQGPLWG